MTDSELRLEIIRLEKQAFSLKKKLEKAHLKIESLKDWKQQAIYYQSLVENRADR